MTQSGLILEHNFSQIHLKLLDTTCAALSVSPSHTHPAASVWTAVLLGQPDKVILPFPNMPAYPCTIAECMWVGKRCYLIAAWKESDGKPVGLHWTPAVHYGLCLFSLSSVFCVVHVLLRYLSISLLFIKRTYSSGSMLCYFANDNHADWCDRSCCKRCSLLHVQLGQTEKGTDMVQYHRHNSTT